MMRINILLWFIFNRKRYNVFEYIQTLDFDLENSYRQTKNTRKDTIDFLTKKLIKK